MSPKNKNADALALGAKRAELAAAIKTMDTLKAKLETGQRELREGWKNAAARLKKLGADLPLGADGIPTDADIERALAEAEGFAIKTKQLADAQVMACGFDPEAARERLGQGFAACFEPKK